MAREKMIYIVPFEDLVLENKGDGKKKECNRCYSMILLKEFADHMIAHD